MVKKKKKRNDPTREETMGLLLTAIAEYYQCNLSIEQLRMYTRDLDDLGPEGIERAFSAMRGTNQVFPGKFPLPGKIREFLYATDEEKALGVVRSIQTAMRRYGRYDPKGAAEFMGPVAWYIVESYGWEMLCNMSADDMSYRIGDIQRAARMLVSARSRTISTLRVDEIEPDTKRRLAGLIGGIASECTNRHDSEAAAPTGQDTSDRKEDDRSLV